jgi:Mg2+ and Co2+ transporter CorA
MGTNYYLDVFSCDASCNASWSSSVFKKHNLFSLFPDLLERDLYIIDETMNFRISSYSTKKDEMLIKFDFIRAIVTKEKVYFIDTYIKSKSHLLKNVLFKNISNAFSFGLNDHINANDHTDVSFENKIIECILMFIDNYYTELLNDIIPKSSKIINSNDDELKTSFEIKKELISIRFAIKDIYDLLESLSEQEIDKFEGFFVEKTFDQFIDTIKSVIYHFEENIDTLNKINDSLDLKLQILDLKSSLLRTKMDKINLLFGIFLICISTCSFVTGVFGMNLNSTIQESIIAFYGTLAGMGIVFVGLFFSIKHYTFDKIRDY